MQQFLTGGVQFAIEERKYYFGKGNWKCDDNYLPRFGWENYKVHDGAFLSDLLHKLSVE